MKEISTCKDVFFHQTALITKLLACVADIRLLQTSPDLYIFMCLRWSPPTPVQVYEKKNNFLTIHSP